MTELTFLVELLLNHKLPKATRDLVAQRIKEVEEGFAQRSFIVPRGSGIQPSQVSQAPSTIALMAKHGLDPGPGFVPPAPEPVAVVAQTPATIAAINSRQQAINESLAGKVDKVTGRPRKF